MYSLLQFFGRLPALFRPAGVLSILCLVSACSEPSAPPARSLLLITIDTLRADHLSCYGYPRSTSPKLDAFIEGGARIEYGFSTAPRTAPSHVSILTGLYPSFNSVGNLNSRFRLEDSFTTLAEHCKQGGLRTGAIVSNPVLNRSSGLAQGFDVYDDRFPDAEGGRAATEKIAERTASAAVSALEQMRDERFFLWVHFQDPHGPYKPPPSYLEAFEGDALSATGVRLEAGTSHAGLGDLPRYQVLGDERSLDEYIRRYDAEIRYLDDQLATVFEALQRLGIAQQTLVVITSDHGEAFGEDGYYCAHGHGLGMDQTRVPLAFVGPGVGEGLVIEGPATNLNVFATALDALGLGAADPMQSRSLMPALERGEEPVARIEFAESMTQRATFGPGGYLRADARPLSDSEFWEQRNPYTGAPRIPLGEAQLVSWGASEPGAALGETLGSFQERADSYRERIEAMRRGELVLSEEEQRKMRALGYLD